MKRRYFVSYRHFGPTSGAGCSEVVRDEPIRGMADVRAIARDIAKATKLSQIVITSWQLFEKE